MSKQNSNKIEKAIYSEKDGSERIVYIQERGSVVSNVSKYPNSSWKTEEVVQTSKLTIIEDDEDGNSSFSSTNDDNYSQYSTVHYNDEGECVGGVLRSE